MSITYPFNFQPASVSVQNGGSYTIPAGFYAHVSVNTPPNANFSIDGTSVQQGFQNSTNQTTNSSTALKMLAAGGFIANALAATTPGGGVTDAGAALSYTTASFTDSAISNNTYWLPTGTVINCASGAVAVVTLYANIS